VSYNGTSTTNCFAAFDGNGNLASLINAADGTSVANYEYGPFGEVVRSTGPIAKINPIRFSTKYQDDESDLLYYGYRSYKPATGSWINRDPAGEKGGVNLFLFVQNSPLSKLDALGLSCSVGGSCGFDVTAAVQKVLQQVEKDFSSPTVDEATKCTACQNLYNPQTAGSDWDIWYLARIGLDKKIQVVKEQSIIVENVSGRAR
jgi:RHS repeat-associated protein